MGDCSYEVSAPKPSVGVLIAAYNEGPSIGAVVRGCMVHTPGLQEVLVVDDGSRDDTAVEAERAGARVYRLPSNQGKGTALREGLARISGDVLVTLDGDGQDPPEEIPRLLGALAPEVDLVVGSRFLGRFERGAITPINRMGNLALTALFNVLFNARITDTQAGFRAFRRRAVEGLPLEARRYDIETEMLVQVLARGGRVVEVGVTRGARAHGRSGLHAARDGARILGRMLQCRARTAGWFTGHTARR
jgi:glycosyltransferase involved in cell wall biosynthesis